MRKATFVCSHIWVKYECACNCFFSAHIFHERICKSIVCVCSMYIYIRLKKSFPTSSPRVTKFKVKWTDNTEIFISSSNHVSLLPFVDFQLWVRMKRGEFSRMFIVLDRSRSKKEKLQDFEVERKRERQRERKI